MKARADTYRCYDMPRQSPDLRLLDASAAPAMTRSKLTQSHGYQCGVYSDPAPLWCSSTSQATWAAQPTASNQGRPRSPPQAATP